MEQSAQTIAPPRPRYLSLAQKEQIVRFVGTPSALTGVVQLYRQAPAKDAFRAATFDLADTEFGHLMQLRQGRLLHSTLHADHLETARLSITRMPAAGRQGTAVLELTLDPHTPPGLFHARIALDGAEMDAEIEVMPQRQTAFLTPYLYLSGAPGTSAYTTLLIENQGNVPEQIGVLGKLVLQEDEQICLSLQSALGAAKAMMKTSDDAKDLTGHFNIFADRMIAELAARHTTMARVIAQEGTMLAPGDVRHVPIRVHLPRDMVPGRRYGSVLIWGTAQVPVAIDATAPTDGDKPDVVQDDPPTKPRKA
jgi:hypothetical protein